MAPKQGPNSSEKSFPIRLKEWNFCDSSIKLHQDRREAASQGPNHKKNMSSEDSDSSLQSGFAKGEAAELQGLPVSPTTQRVTGAGGVKFGGPELVECDLLMLKYSSTKHRELEPQDRQ